MEKIHRIELFIYSFFFDRIPTKRVLYCCIEYRNQHDEYSIYIFERLQICTSTNDFKIQNEGVENEGI